MRSVFAQRSGIGIGLNKRGMGSMSEEREDQERPCLHCMMVELIDDFFAEYPATARSDNVDTMEQMEVIDARRRADEPAG